MGEKVHFWSDIPDSWSLSPKRDADKHADTQHGTSVHIDSIEKLKSVFRSMLKANTTLDMIDFHTHGGGGVINLGSDLFHFDNVETQLGNQEFDKLFNKNAAIIFTGCNVGDKYTGELFLVRVGSTLLKTNGGKVMGNTGLGEADPIFTGEVFHPTGTWVSANVSIGGGVTLVNNTYLIPENVHAKIKELQTKLNKLSGDNSRSVTQLYEAKTAINNALGWMQGATNTSYANMFNAWANLDKAELAMVSAESLSFARGNRL